MSLGATDMMKKQILHTVYLREKGGFHDPQLMTAIIICESFNNNFINFIDDNIVLKLGSARTHEPICGDNILMRSLDASQQMKREL